MEQFLIAHAPDPVLHRSGRPCCLECDSDRVLARLYQLVWESAMQTDRCHNIEALRAGARRKLPRPVFDYIDGGAEDELALRRSATAFDENELLPRTLVDVSNINGETEIFGRRIPFPIKLATPGIKIGRGSGRERRGYEGKDTGIDDT